MGILALLVIDPSQEPATLSEQDGDVSPVSPEDRMADAKLKYYYPCESTPIEDRRNTSSIFRGVVEFATFCGNGISKSGENNFFKIKSSNSYTLIKLVEENILLAIVFDLIESEKTAQQLFVRLYETYRLLHGPIASKLNLTETFEDFITSFISAEIVAGEPTTVTLDGLRYAPIERHGFVAMHAVGCEILAQFESEISDFFILFSGHLVSTSFDPESFRPLYKYLVMNSRDGTVNNGKLASPPFDRIGTPAALPGGGLSSYGRSNKFENQSGWLFGPTGQSISVFCPHVWLDSSTSSGSPMSVFVHQEVMYGFLFKSSPQISVFEKLERYITDNNELNKEIVPLVRNDFSLSQSVAIAEDDHAIQFVYRNTVNQSGMFSKEPSKTMIPGPSSAQSSAAKKLLRSATSLLYPFTVTPPLDSTHQLTSLRDMMQEILCSRKDVFEIAVKRSSNEGWKIAKKSSSGREVFYAFKNPRMPFWKALIDVEQFNSNRFNSVYL